MTHLVCPKCGSNDHTCGYGLAAGPMGGYCFCDGCDELLEASPDLQGLSVEEANRIIEAYNTKMREVWGDKHEDRPLLTEN